MTTALCTACGHTFPVPAVATCPACASSSVRRAEPDAEVLREYVRSGALDAKPAVKRAVERLIREEVRL